MAVYKRGGVWWYSFIFAGKRVQESAKTARKTIAGEAEKRRRLELEKALAGMPVEDRASRIMSVAEIIRAYLETYEINHRPKSLIWANGCLAHVERLVGSQLLTDVTEQEIRRYIKTRLDEGASGRTINMELGELSRVIGKPWRTLWPKVRKLEERKDIGRALSPDEESRLLDAVRTIRSPLIGTFVRCALLTGMRSGEILSLQWGQIDFERRVLTVGKAKTASGTGRQIPISAELFEVLAAHAQWCTVRFGKMDARDYVFPWGSPMPTDASRPTTTIKTAWGSLRGAAGVQCRLHDLRHTAATKMAEAGVPESTMLALMGHMSRAMLERYSHIRMAAKREAVEALRTVRRPASSDSVSTISTTVGQPRSM